MAKITLDNGMVIEGSVEEIKAMAEAFGVKEADELKESEPTYRLVSGRDTRVGDYVKFTEESYEWITVGKYYEIVNFDEYGDALVLDNDGDSFCIDGETYEIYEKVTEAPAESAEPEPLKVGDYAKVIQENHRQNGDIVKLEEYNGDYRYDFRSIELDGTKGDIFKPEHLVKATEEEVAEAKAKFERQQAEAKETERWTKIGREVNEFKSGDIVRVNLISESAISSHLKRGEMGEVGEISDDGFRVNGRLSSVNWVEPLDVELITPVEARFDRE